MREVKTAEQMIIHYKNMREVFPNSSMLMEAREQYIDMATGGDGGDTGMGTSIRDTYYKNKPDSYFKKVASELGWI